MDNTENQDIIEFEDYLECKLQFTKKRLTSYCGIDKKTNPCWYGWKEIARLKQENIELTEVNELLDNLVYVFYAIDYLKFFNLLSVDQNE